MEGLFVNKYFLAFYGVILYEIVNFSIAKDYAEFQKNKFDIKIYFNRRWDNILVLLLFAPVIAMHAQDMVAIVSFYFNVKTIEFKTYWYLGVGILVRMLYGMLKKYSLLSHYDKEMRKKVRKDSE
jgi:hypothetical protein